MSLDLDAARRQTLATSYRQEDVDRLLAGKLLMPPHPEWTLPERATWREDPFQDRNWRFQFHMLRWLEPLRRAASRGDDAAFEMWLSWVEDWVASNPVSDPVTEWAWTDMSDGIRAQQLCQAAPMIAERRPDLLAWLEETIRIHADHLADPRKMGNANHALHQQESLFVCGRVLDDASLWRLASDRMERLLHEQYDEQGINAEGATAYHVNNYLWWENALRRFDKESLTRPRGSDRHLRAPEAIAHATRPDGTLVAIGDTDTVVPNKVRSPHTAYVTTNGADGEPPARNLALFDAGYLFARSGWGDEVRPYSEHTHYSLRFGPAVRVHGHPDGTAVTYSSHGINWVTDLGKYQYGQGVERNHFASRAAHSLVSIEGVAPIRHADVELVRRRITPRFHDVTLSDDSFLLQGIDLTRRLVYSVSGEYLVVVDRVSSPKPVMATQRWQLGPDVDAASVPSSSRVDLTADDSDAVAVLAFVSEPREISTLRAQPDPFDGWISVGWKQHVPATVVTAQEFGTEITFITVIAGSRGEVEAHALPWTRKGEHRIEVATGDATERILLTESTVTINAA